MAKIASTFGLIFCFFDVFLRKKTGPERGLEKTALRCAQLGVFEQCLADGDGQNAGDDGLGHTVDADDAQDGAVEHVHRHGFGGGILAAEEQVDHVHDQQGVGQGTADAGYDQRSRIVGHFLGQGAVHEIGDDAHQDPRDKTDDQTGEIAGVAAQ